MQNRGHVVDLAVKLIVVALVIGGIWWALQPRYVFVIRIKDGGARLARGKVTSTFLEQVGHACAESGVSRGWVGGVWRGKRLALAFSRNIPPGCQQRLRNLWALQG